MTNPFALALAAVVGSCAGSYAATLAVRVARQEQSVFGRSACDNCGVSLSFARTVPLFSYVRSGGACRVCSGRIDPAHFAGEALGAGIAAAAFWVAVPERAALIALVGIALLAASIVDIKTQRLPHVLIAVVAVCGLALSAAGGLQTLEIAAASAVIAFAVMELTRWALGRLKGEPVLGAGDVVLLAALALWLGPATPWALVLASVGGLVVARIRKEARGRIAFGPYLAAAAWPIGLYLELAK